MIYLEFFLLVYFIEEERYLNILYEGYVLYNQVQHIEVFGLKTLFLSIGSYNKIIFITIWMFIYLFCLENYNFWS